MIHFITLIFLTILEILTKETKPSCIHFKNNRTTLDWRHGTYDKINIVEFVFDCKKSNLLNSGCLRSITNNSVHFFDRWTGSNHVSLDSFFISLRNTNRDATEGHSILLKKIIHSFEVMVNKNNVYIQRNKYKRGKLIVPTNKLAINTYKLHNRNVIKRNKETSFIVTLPINKRESFYYEYDVNQNNGGFEIMNLSMLYQYSFICSSKIISIEAMKEINELRNTVKRNVIVKKNVSGFYLMNSEVLSIYSNAIGNLGDSNSNYMNKVDITPVNCEDNMTIDPILERFCVGKHTTDRKTRLEFDHVTLKNVRLSG
eukprot:GAHX01001390.1.p1 GENE.GAHX01001390.1~~GAHX01001390.1.p1  ORF type:complete len:314 (-),score=21.51 GAHX01001390.1:83-1024(-)